MPLQDELASADPTATQSEPYWSWPLARLLEQLRAGRGGLSSAQARERLEHYGPNALAKRRFSWLGVLGNQLKSPLVLLLLFAAIASGATGEWVDATIVIAIVAASVMLGFSREYAAETAAAALRARVQTLVSVLRDEHAQRVPVEEVVPGDIVLLSAGSLVPADGVLLEATDLHHRRAPTDRSQIAGMFVMEGRR